MNESLKAVLDEAFDLEVLVKHAVAQDWSASFSDLVKAGTDLPALISKVSGVLPELQALLVDPMADSDFVAYVTGKLAGETTKVQAVATAVLDLLVTLAQLGPKAIALVGALKS